MRLQRVGALSGCMGFRRVFKKGFVWVVLALGFLNFRVSVPGLFYCLTAEKCCG